MELIIIIILTLSLGIILGDGYLPILKKNSHVLPFAHSNKPVEFKKNNIFEIEKSKSHFDTLELRFLMKLIDSKKGEMTVSELNQILNLNKLSSENQRQRRHIFLKDINVKLKMLFNIYECIERISNLDDRRIKTYHLSEKINKKELKNLLT